MLQSYNNFIELYNKQNLDIYPTAYSSILYSFTFHLIENPKDINKEFVEEINEKIKETTDVIINFEKRNSSYLAFCIERMLIVIKFEHLSLLKDSFLSKRDLKYFFINDFSIAL